MNRYIWILFYLVFSFQVPAHWTNDIVSNTMLLYLYHDVLPIELDTLKEQYAKHIAHFNTQEIQHINKKWASMRAQASPVPPTLKADEDRLNITVREHNHLIEQIKQKAKEQARLQQKINEEQQKQRAENQHQIDHTLEQINGLVNRVNNANRHLSKLHSQEQNLRLFYDNQEYMSEPNLQDHLAKLNKWNDQINQKLQAQTNNYNQAVSDFETKQEEQERRIAKRRAELLQKAEQLQSLQLRINTLISQYNQDRQATCKTNPCIHALQNQQALIEEKKQIYKEKSDSFNEEVGLFNRHVHQTERQQTVQKAQLNKEKQALAQFRKATATEREQKNQAWEEHVQDQQSRAFKEWERAQKNLSHFQSQLTANYGEDFYLFLEKLAHWSQATEPSLHESYLADLPVWTIALDGNQSAPEQKAICEYSALYPLALEPKKLCEWVIKLQGLRKKTIDVNNQNRAHPLQQSLDTLSLEITELQKKAHTLSVQNENQKAQLNQSLREYQEQQEQLKKEQYTKWRKERQQIQNQKNQFIKQAYIIKGHLLNQEYNLLKAYWTFSSPPLAESLSLFKDIRTQFLSFISGEGPIQFKGFCVSALKEPNSPSLDRSPNTLSCSHYISGFPEGFTDPYKLMMTLYAKTRNSPHVTQPHLSIDSPQESFSLAGQQSHARDSISFLEGTEKQSAILSWMHTPFISDLLNKMITQIVDSLRKVEIDPLSPTEPLIDTKIHLAVRYLFAESFYQDIPFQKNTKSNWTHYEMLFNNDKILWFESSGKLKMPEGIYQ